MNCDAERAVAFIYGKTVGRVSHSKEILSGARHSLSFSQFGAALFGEVTDGKCVRAANGRQSESERESFRWRGNSVWMYWCGWHVRTSQVTNLTCTKITTADDDTQTLATDAPKTIQ